MNRRDFFRVTGVAAVGAALGIGTQVEQETEGYIQVDEEWVELSRSDWSAVKWDGFKADVWTIDHSMFQEKVIVNRVYTDEQGRTTFDITRNI
jgi:hypothetical protein